MMKNGKIRVLIVEDTMVVQRFLKTLVLSDERFKLVGIAENGKQACEMIEKLAPDVVSMDIMMPVMDGVEATRTIMQEYPVPIVIVSSFYESSEVDMAIKVLEAGAVMILPRPHGPGHPKHLRSALKYLNSLQLMSEVKVVRRIKIETAKTQQVIKKTILLPNEDSARPNYQALAIGASAGGPEGLTAILSGLPANFPLPVFIVQHIDSHFAEGFAVWLNTSSRIPVTIAINGEKILPGHAYLPSKDHHLTVNSNGTISLTRELSERSLRPSVDVLFRSIGQVFGKNSIAVLLSGMGKDGTVELKNLFDLGAFTIAQDEMSCLVYGMPGEAVRIGAVCKIIPSKEIASEIINLLQ